MTRGLLRGHFLADMGPLPRSIQVRSERNAVENCRGVVPSLFSKLPIGEQIESRRTRFNVFRRFREAVLQRSEARQILIDYWMGHSNPSMGDRYGTRKQPKWYNEQRVRSIWACSSAGTAPALQARARAPMIPSLALAFLMIPTISGNRLLARSKPRTGNPIGFLEQ